MIEISCIIPTYNYAEFLEEAVLSVADQTLPPKEIIIVDDNSNDDTEKIAKNLTQRFPIIKYIKNEKNLGLVENFNKGVSLAQFEYICILGADDKLDKTYFEKANNIFNANSQTSIVYSDLILFGPYAKEAYLKYNNLFKDESQKYLIQFPEFNTPLFQELFFYGTNFINTSSIYNKEIFTKLNGYRNLYDQGIPEDYDFFKRAIENDYKPEHLPEPLLFYRHHSPRQNNVYVSTQAEILFLKQKNQELLDDIKFLKEQNSNLLKDNLEAKKFIERKEEEIKLLKEKTGKTKSIWKIFK